MQAQTEAHEAREHERMSERMQAWIEVRFAAYEAQQHELESRIAGRLRALVDVDLSAQFESRLACIQKSACASEGQVALLSQRVAADIDEIRTHHSVGECEVQKRIQQSSGVLQLHTRAPWERPP